MPRRVFFTPEEKSEDYKDVEAMIRDNQSYTVIANELGRSRQYVCDIKKDLEAKEVLTQDEIEAIKIAEREHQNGILDQKVLSLLQDGKCKTQVKRILRKHNYRIDESITRLEEQRKLDGIKTDEEKAYEEDLRKIKEAVDNKVFPEEIARQTGIPISTVRRYLNILIELGEIKEGDIVNQQEVEKQRVADRNKEIYALLDAKVPVKKIAEKYSLTPSSIYLIRKNRGKKPKWKPKNKKPDYNVKEIDDSLSEMEVKIITFLKKGYEYTYIHKILTISQRELMAMVNDLKKRKYITQTIINEAREARRKYYLEQILKFLRLGYAQADIHRELNGEIEEISKHTILRMIEELKKQGKITDEEIESSRANNSESFAAIDNRVFLCLKEGMVVSEIVESDETGYLTEMRVRMSKKRLKKAGRITDEEIEQYRQQREKKEKSERWENESRLIWGYVKQFGYSDEKIAKEMDCSPTYVCVRRSFYMKRHKITVTDYIRTKKEAKNKIGQSLQKKFIEAKNKFLRQYENDLPSKEIKKAYYEAFRNLDENYHFSKEEIDILVFVILYEEEYLNAKNIEYAMQQYMSIGEEAEAEKFLNLYIANTSKSDEVMRFKRNMMKMITDYHNQPKQKVKH